MTGRAVTWAAVIAAAVAVGQGVRNAYEQGINPVIEGRFPHLGNPRADRRHRRDIQR